MRARGETAPQGSSPGALLRERMAPRAALVIAIVLLGACRDVATLEDDGGGTTVGSSATGSGAGSASASSSTGSGSCAGPCDSYSAINLFTNAGAVAILKRDDARDLCFQLGLDALSMEVVDLGQYPLDLIKFARVTHDADDCAPWTGIGPPTPIGEIANATSLGGKLAISAPPCAVDVEGVMSFADGLDWTPDAEPLGRTGLVIDGGCP